MKKRCSAMAAALCAATAFAADPIVRQEREGTHLVVEYSSGRVETNSLFLAMSPQVKQAVALAAARAELESAILESAGVARGKPADKAGALAAAAAEHRKGNGKDVVKGLGLLAAGAALGSAAGRKGKVTA